MLSSISKANGTVHLSPACEAAFHRYRFANVEVDFQAAELRRSGVRVRIQDQPLHLLAALLSRPGELVTREELRQLLWSDNTFVDFDHSLNSAVKRLRDVLNDNPDNPRLIETIPRHGYRFIAPVSQINWDAQGGIPALKVSSEAAPRRAASVPLPSDTSRSSRRMPRYVWIILLAGLLLAAAILVGLQLSKMRAHDRALPPKITLAVLPFHDLSENGLGGSIAAGMTQELTTQLGKLAPEEVTLVAHTSSDPLNAPGKPFSSTAKKRETDYLLEGSTRVQGAGIRIAVQLIRAGDRQIVWAEAFDQPIGDVLDVQQRVARAVTGAVRAKLNLQGIAVN